MKMKSLAHVRFRGSVVPVIPLHAVAAFFISLMILCCLFVVLDWRWSPGHGQEGPVASPAWYWEDKRININNEFKVFSSEPGFLWMSKGFPVSPDRTMGNRILVMGDSFVWGDGYANMNDLWWRQLQRQLARRGYSQVEVVAAGYPGFSTRAQLAAATQLVPEIKPDAIIWGYTTNDPDEGMVPSMREDTLLFRDSLFNALNGLCEMNILPNFTNKLRDLRREKISLSMSGKTHGYAYPEWELQILEGPNWGRYQNTVANLKTFLSDVAIPSFMVTLPSYPGQEYHKIRYAKVKDLYQSLDVPFYNVLEDILVKVQNPEQRNDVRRWGINPVNSHPGPAMTHFCAVLTADILEKDYRNVLGPRTPRKEPEAPHINDWIPFDLNPVSLKEGSWTMEIPVAEKYMLRLPSGEPFVQLNLENPVGLRAVRVAGEGLDSAGITITAESPNLGYDDGTLHPFDWKKGADLEWDLSGQTCAGNVNTIRLRTCFANSDRRVQITLVTAVEGVRE